MTRGQPARDGLDAIDEAVAQISDAEVDMHLANVLRQGGFRSNRGEHTEHTQPAFRLEQSPGSHGPERRTRPGWFAPLAAAAAVVLVVAGGVAAGTWLARSGNGQSGNHGALEQVASAGPFAGVPAYYVEVPGSQASYSEAPNQSSAVVRATATGATLARVTTSAPIVGVTGAADDRTFVLDAQRSIMGPTVLWPGQPAFYLLRLSASGAEESFTRLAVPAIPDGTVVSGLALSPDGSKLAVDVDSGTSPWTARLMEIMTYTLATGAFRSWTTSGMTNANAPFGFTGSGVDGSESISWAADGRTLAFDWTAQGSTQGVRLLDTAASGDNLIADSRIAIEFDPKNFRPGQLSTSKDHVSSCVTDSIISLDGSAIVCGYTTNMGGADTTTGFIRYSTSTGQMTAVLGVYEFGGQAGGDISLFWVNSTGNVLIGGVLTSGGIRVGVINGEKFTPLPGITGLGAAAW